MTWRVALIWLGTVVATFFIGVKFNSNVATEEKKLKEDAIYEYAKLHGDVIAEYDKIKKGAQHAMDWVLQRGHEVLDVLKGGKKS